MRLNQRAFVLAVRDTLGWKQTDLGKELGREYNAAHDWETGRVGLPYETAVLLIERCGWFTEDAVKALATARAKIEAADARALAEETRKSALGLRNEQPPRRGRATGS